MADPSKLFVLANLALAFYLVGAVWAHEADIFRSWRLVPPQAFHRIQQAHWRKLPYWVFAPLALAFAGGLTLIWFHPSGSPLWASGATSDCRAPPAC